MFICLHIVLLKTTRALSFFPKGGERGEGFFHNMYIYFSRVILPLFSPLFAQATLGERELFSLFVMSSLCQPCFNGVNNGVDIIFYIAFDCKCCN